MTHDAPAYGLWSLVVINSAIFILFAFSFFKPATRRDWRPIHLASNVLIVVGFFVLSAAWRVLYRAQREGRVATTGPYARVRHPQYDAFVVIMFGFLLQWPTLVTLVMFPVLVTVYVRLARCEEREARARFGPAWDAYAAVTPPFVPQLRPRRALVDEEESEMG
jgi:protein-S-isoprenylcysteine O-methyltransferase Ste14